MQRGEAYVGALLQISSAGSAHGEGSAASGLLGGIARKFELERWTAWSAFRGVIVLDDDQFDNVLAICGGPVEDGASTFCPAHMHSFSS